MQKIGELAAEGISVEELEAAKAKFEAAGAECKLVDLASYAPKDQVVDPAAVLIIRDGVKLLLKDDDAANKLFQELHPLDWDKKKYMDYFKNKSNGGVVNARARHNLCFADEAQEPDYENKKGRIIPWSDVPLTAKVRTVLPEYLGVKANDLLAEGNHYYNKGAGIRWHGDRERRKVIAVRLGESMPLDYHWWHDGKPIGTRAELKLNHGDVYVMSAKAVGTDCRTKKIPTLRHAAGAPKYRVLKDDFIDDDSGDDDADAEKAGTPAIAAKGRNSRSKTRYGTRKKRV